MSRLSPSVLYSFLPPALLLLYLLGAMARAMNLKLKGLKWCIGLGLVALSLVALPLGGLPIGRWLAGIVDHWSIPSVALLTSLAAREFLGVEILRHTDRQWAWRFGVVAGMVLYPAALGWGQTDPFAWGWNFSSLFAAMAVLAAALIWAENRFGVVLVLAIAGWHFGVAESGNYWDCLLDPFYVLVSLGAVGWQLLRALPNTENRPTGSGKMADPS